MQILNIFNPEIYGTISDWVMIIVTTVTAIFLYKTLKSQKEVQQTQTELFKIENLRFKESIKPILKYSASIDKFKCNEDNKKILTIEVTNETNSLALEISKVLTKNEYPIQIFIPTGFSDSRNHLVKGDQPLFYNFLIDSKLSFVPFNIYYKDIAGTKYKQGVLCTCDNFGIEINPFLPEII